MNIRNLTMGLSALLLTGLAVASPAQAADSDLDVPELVDTVAKPVCPPYNPEAWFNCSVTVSPFTRSVRAYNVDATPPTTPVCPIGTICVQVPVVYPNGVVYDYTYYVTLYNPDVWFEANPDKVFEDACAILGPVCLTLQDLLASRDTVA